MMRRESSFAEAQRSIAHDLRRAVDHAAEIVEDSFPQTDPRTLAYRRARLRLWRLALRAVLKAKP